MTRIPPLRTLPLTILLTAWLEGPILGGQRVPINLPIFPDTLAIPTDADVTATIYATLLDDAIFDGGAVAVDVAFERFFVDWRDLGVVPRRLNPSWLPPASGAFLTWLTYRDPPFPLFPERCGSRWSTPMCSTRWLVIDRLDVPGVAEAVGFINLVTALGLHRELWRRSPDYYPDNLTFQYAVSRAFREGPVPALEPAVEILADDLEASALFRTDGTAYWDQGRPSPEHGLRRAHASQCRPRHADHRPRDRLPDRRAESLSAASTRRPSSSGVTDGGQVFEFTSASFTTAMVLEALGRHGVAH